MSRTDGRASGVLMHISSLPGGSGIGTLGRAAREFVDALSAAGQSYWQILPVNPTGFGDSPYQSFSTAAGNPYFIDLDLLADDGLLPREFASGGWGDDPRSVDYGLLFRRRNEVFREVQERFVRSVPGGFADFCAENADWLDDYALFMAIKDSLGGIPLCGWAEPLRRRDGDALAEVAEREREGVERHKMLQFLFFRQWKSLREYANSRGISIIGDIPIYVSADSVDVWTSPEQFLLDENLAPTVVAGCPPDAFSPKGQLWGNPVYDWERQAADGFSWWRSRLERSFSLYDVVRIDHFRGFESFYAIPAGREDATVGEWRKGPGIALFRALDLGRGGAGLRVIAEDLGFMTADVRKMLAESGFPGMKLLQFAFDTRDSDGNLPEKYVENSVAYTGTHDNDTLAGWVGSAPPECVRNAERYTGAKRTAPLVRAMMETSLNCVSRTCILTMQDILGLGSGARMNTPSTPTGNWRWRATAEELGGADWAWLSAATARANRA